MSECIKDIIQEKISIINTKIAVLESSQNTVREDLKSVREDVKSINIEISKITQTIEDRFTDLDRKQIEDLKTNKNLVYGIIISIGIEILVPILLFFVLRGK